MRLVGVGVGVGVGETIQRRHLFHISLKQRKAINEVTRTFAVRIFTLCSSPFPHPPPPAPSHKENGFKVCLKANGNACANYKNVSGKSR